MGVTLMNKESIKEWHDINNKYQAFIDEIYKTSAKNPAFTDCAFLLACAIKECMTHKDDEHGFIGTGYLSEKIGRALNRVGLNWCIYEYANKDLKLKIIQSLSKDLDMPSITRAVKREVKANA